MHVALLEPDAGIASWISESLLNRALKLVHFDQAGQLCQHLKTNTVDAVLLNSGLLLASHSSLKYQADCRLDHLPGLILSTDASGSRSEDALHCGRKGVLKLPCSADELWQAFRLSLDSHPATDSVGPGPIIVAEHPVMLELIRQARVFAACDANMLITGPTGAGKELFAQTAHQRHPRRADGPFIAVNCAAIPHNLFESQFFGHEKGAFTHAVAQHAGFFEQADGGTLFLDEVGELPLEQQGKLLRVLQDQKVQRVGASRATQVNVRVVSATNRDIHACAQSGKFRMDLLYRLAVIQLQIPSLDERGSADKKALFRYFFERFQAEYETITDQVPPWLIERIGNTAFPGNVRELASITERIAIMLRHTGNWTEAWLSALLPAPMQVGNAPATTSLCDRRAKDLGNTRRRAECQKILDALNANGWSRTRTAEALGISRKSLWEKMRKFSLTERE